MQAVKRILVVIDPSQEEQVALNRASLIAGFIECELHLLVCENREDYSDLLARLRVEQDAKGIRCSVTQDWHHNSTDTICRAVAREGCDLVVKQHRPDNPLRKALLTPDDWKLLRYCPAPVLMVKNSDSWIKGSVLAAVDVGNHDDQHHVLHDTIVSHAADIVEMIDGDLHLVSAHPAPMLSAADPAFQLKDSIAAEYRTRAEPYAKLYDIDAQHLHIDEGPADTLVPQIANRIGASVTIIGTVGRKGIAGALIGNTAEVVLDQVNSDILVLKPEDTLAHLEALLEK
ncbi:universal stress protein [Halopseudomonas pachastrellae]|uniref:universal stress protein n=1 Tax=Halopseudomonas pachastrellae TaxID=254161 RepID=UPI003D7E5965|tara:strand:- start:16173 stop:17033 length:861 start_codon:yes stop_codon:yes gene_type:complete